MSDSDRGKRSAPKLIAVGFGALLLIVAGAAAVGWGLLQEAKYRSEADSRENHYSSRTYAPERNACLILPFKNQADCIAQADQAARENERSERDLVAQRVTAVWTSIMGGAAVIGMLLSIVGVFLVWTTFKATSEATIVAKKSADDALVATREIGQAQVRAYLGATALHYEATGNFLQCQIDLKNYGQSPAFRVRVDAEVFVRGPIANATILPARSAVGEGKCGPINAGGTSDDVNVLFHFEIMDGLPDHPFNAAGTILTVTCIIKYDDVFGQHRHSAVTFSRGIGTATLPSGILKPSSKDYQDDGDE